MREITLTAGQPSLHTLEIMFKLKIRDVMTTNVITARRIDTLRYVQNLMRVNEISGVPIAEDGRLFGILSVDNILRALDFGYIDDTVEPHMTRNLVVLDDDMPLSFGLSYFEKYNFGRFPVLDKNEKLIGIVTSRDIMSKLLAELNIEIDKIESATLSQANVVPGKYYREFSVKRFDFESGGIAANEFKKVLKEKGYDTKFIRRVSIAAYELEMNLVAHSLGGKISCYIVDNKIEILVRDQGPGIPNIENAMREGFSTANEWIRSLGFGAGMGLPNAKRVSDEFDIRSQVGLGTSVKATFLVPVVQANNAP